MVTTNQLCKETLNNIKKKIIYFKTAFTALIQGKNIKKFKFIQTKYKKKTIT